MTTIVLPWPARELSPNARIDRRAKARLVAEHRAAAAMVTSTLPGSHPTGKVDLSIIFYPPDRRRRDLDNCYSSCKFFQDGIFEALGLDDGCIQRVELRFGPPRPRGEVVWYVEEAQCETL